MDFSLRKKMTLPSGKRESELLAKFDYDEHKKLKSANEC